MMQNEADNIRIAITSDSVTHRNYLQKSMEYNGIQVVLNESLTEKFMNKLDSIKSDVLIFDVASIEDEHIEYLERLLEQSKIPVIIDDVSALTLNEPKASFEWNNKLLKKIANITGRNSWEEDFSNVKLFEQKEQGDIRNKDKLAKNVWVLGASLGGPEALKRFLAEIPADLPVTFVIAQHLGENFVSLLAEQLDRYTAFKVLVPKAGHVVRHHEVLVTPTDERIVINPIGAVELKKIPENIKYTPSINHAIHDVAVRYKHNSGAIIFSGMCDDGVEGCEVLAKIGGQVWVQDAASCVISAMSESVAKKVPVNFSGTPEVLAKQLVSFYKNTH
ncbi:MAG: chemotaxis protein CheB [Gammaproteobacteria bacterium]|nr:chemotaxis protein CheB [Gammaproteobacteria bacterium]MCW8986914.1 chemotaxis protein CheB [Gammaproteobacteria bacterium]